MRHDNSFLARAKAWVQAAIKPKAGSNPNQSARRGQVVGFLLVALLIGGTALAYWSMNATKTAAKKAAAPHFAGSLDDEGNGSDDPLYGKFRDDIDALKSKLAKKQAAMKTLKATPAPDNKLLAKYQAMNNKVTALMLKITSLEKAQASAPVSYKEEANNVNAQARRTNQPSILPENLSLESAHFDYTPPPKAITRNAHTYVWPNTFVDGVVETGQLGDAGLNGTHNQGVAIIRLIKPGNMPNNQHSHLSDCRVSASYYGDLSGNSVVMHLQTLSCAKDHLKLAKKVYGVVFDRDAMQDLRGVPVLKTKPILGYAALAGALEGVGKGLSASGTTQTVSPDNGVAVIQTGSMLRSGLGEGLAQPANKISDYLMKIADLYHPLVVAHAGRRVTILFSKGFWLDKTHNPFDADGDSAPGVAAAPTDSLKRSLSQSAQSFMTAVNAPINTNMPPATQAAPRFVMPDGQLTKAVANTSHDIMQQANQQAMSGFTARQQATQNPSFTAIPTGETTDANP